MLLQAVRAWLDTCTYDIVHISTLAQRCLLVLGGDSMRFQCQSTSTSTAC
jgi:hypothetical protein